jgi:hypothetical protein
VDRAALRIAQRVPSAVRKQRQVAGGQERHPFRSFDLQAGAPAREQDDVRARAPGELDTPGRTQLEAAMHVGGQAHRVQNVREDISALPVQAFWTLGQFIWTG